MRHRCALLTIVLAAIPVAGLAQESTASSSQNAEADAEALTAFNTAENAFEDGDLDLALRLFERAYSLSSRPELLYNIASCAERLGNKTKALEAYAAFVEALPDHERARLARGRIAAMNADDAEHSDDDDDDDDSRVDLRVGIPLAVAGVALVGVGIVGLLTTDECSMTSADGTTCTARTVVAAGPTTAYFVLGGLALVAGVTWVIVGRSRAGDSDSAQVSLRVSPTGASVTGQW